MIRRPRVDLNVDVRVVRLADDAARLCLGRSVEEYPVDPVEYLDLLALGRARRPSEAGRRDGIGVHGPVGAVADLVRPVRVGWKVDVPDGQHASGQRLDEDVERVGARGVLAVLRDLAEGRLIDKTWRG